VLRVVGGVAGGRRLVAPAGRDTRPTGERAREGLFSTLDALGGVAGRRVLDLYAGSGALGIEALSRGAAEVVLVERDARAADVIRRNLATVGLPGARLLRAAVSTVLAEAPEQPFDVVLADPPYATDVGPALDLLVTNDWLGPGALVAVERSSRDPALRWPAGVEGLRERRYGEATLWYGRRADGGETT
jgi:16S rRNA (guanine966-N2)-methyltransferase